MRASLNLIPMKERLASPGEAGTKLLKIRFPLTIEILDQRAGLVWFASIWLVNVGEDHAEARDRCWRSPVGPGMKNEPSVTLLPTGVNNRDGLKVVKMVA